ncbi:hypothetical protein N4T77_11480 [Clostridium sp. CX1]|uniref:hypothetical protein n=1 Tax=Clostridium sp. CX1 TaxID=2978346 RepID=UPI0021BFDE91|nr:hypothetical protein [Clostridium sp. CX1]MCT8977224.1 hypothetical protein [Clostridium sp. CX1]
MSICRVRDVVKHPDCIALSKVGRCTRLNIGKCKGEECTFKRTHKEEFNSIQHAYQRLANLDRSIQSHIAKKYYGGYMPWSKENLLESIENIES